MNGPTLSGDADTKNPGPGDRGLKGGAQLETGAAGAGRRATYIDDGRLPAVTDEMLRALLATTQPYTVIVLKPGPRYSPPGPDRDPEVAELILQHGKRNLALRAAGLMPIICPIADEGPFTGIGIFVTDPAETDRIYSLDPAVQAGVLSYEIHPTRSFPGSTLLE